MNTELIVKLIPLFPLAGFALTGLYGKRLGRPGAGWVATGAIGLAFVATLVVLFRMLGMPGEERTILAPVYKWMDVADGLGGRPLDIPLGFLVDPLSMSLMLIVTGVGFLIHLYSIEYMGHDERFSRFFSLMNLFVTFMLLLVMGSSFPVLFIGWEGVGVCSYLLIGFWFEDIENSKAGTKAFVMNRVGDLGLLLAMFWMFHLTGTLTFEGVFGSVASLPGPALTGITLLLLLGATGKSAQIPLYTWLPDAMAGPTPVSALIHAATMVTGGVYLVARCWVLFSSAPVTAFIVAVVGVLTALLAASIALVQFDLKKILAYSTISQLGLMFLGEGANGYQAGYYHVFTHAFFKACLFLGAGAVMHALANNIDVRRMGNLKRYMPVTRMTYLIAVIAIAGIPPLAGFWSKDEILAATLARGGPYVILWVGGLLVSYLTALYMFRSYYLAFEGEERVDWQALQEAARRDHGEDHGRAQPAGALTDEQKRHLIHETPLIKFVLWALAVGSAVAGIFGVSGLAPGVLANLSFEGWLEPSMSSWWNRAAGITPHALVHTGHVNHVAVAALSTLVAAAGWYTAYALHRRGELEKSCLPGPLWTLLWHKYHVDDAYSAVFINGGGRAADRLWQDVDLGVVDTAVNGSGVMVRRIGDFLRRWNNGFVRSYAFSILVGAAMVAVYVLYYVSAAKGAS